MRYLKVIGINVLVLLSLLLTVELGLRATGCSMSLFEVIEDVEFDPIFWGDDAGITAYVKQAASVQKLSRRLPSDNPKAINPQGFFSPYAFDEAVVQKRDDVQKILVVGDSYTEGCCAVPKYFSFAQLMDSQPQFQVFNAGIGGTDPLQYRLVVQKYLPILKPDLIMVFVYLGNDLMNYPRQPRPGFPMNIAIKNYGLLKSEVTFGDSLYQFESAEEAYQWHVDKLTLEGKNQPAWKQWLGKSYLMSLLYKGLFILPEIEQHDPLANRLPYTNRELKKIDSLARASATPIRFMAIPSVQDVVEQVELEERYGFVFEGLDWDAPDLSTFWAGDYDGLTLDNHFNRVGHIKYYLFLMDLLSPPSQPVDPMQ